MKLNLLFFSAVTAIMLSTGCSQNHEELSANEAFLAYHEQSKTNLDFEVETSFYTNEKVKEVQSRFPHYVKQWKMSNVDEVKERYMAFISGTAKCMELNLKEEVEGYTETTLVYDVNDSCNNHQGATQTVLMKRQEGKWKIHSTEIVL